ncbi:hypothetical protein BDZ90DRAFT_229829 [Jaminaea rosea]|uniref:Uncharacterized protein n=1 Tax=Jaminaea rosea TaxID=1569628 RepID=A0A316V0R5_9BASI|nr:hypothetical protein BDZ90DRAFT_229829 [Jaminaea rosea]PWN30834.1 hypothetical protein BDZ90DRAFT_229829 [Jaminaea rosea]
MSSPKHHPTPSGQAPKPKGILKNPLERRPSQPGGAEDIASSSEGLSIDTSNAPQGQHVGPNGLSWDESNIALHDFEKESTQRMKIDEPKTPFVHGSGLSDDEGGFDSFALDNSQSPGPSSAASGSISTGGQDDAAAAELAANTNANASLGGGAARRPSGSGNAAPAVGLDAADLAHSGTTPSGPNPDGSLSATSAEGGSRSNRTQSRSPSFSLPSSGSSSRRASSRSAGGADDSRSGVRRENMDVDGGAEEEAVVGVDDEVEDEDAETKAQREAFAKKRNAHYGNEAEALKVAKALAAKEDEEDDDGDQAMGNNGPNGV